ncbi:MAG: cysteine-rich CWC family protein [Propionivibrio sp.]
MPDRESVKQNNQLSACAGCGAPFLCGAQAGLATCWCMEKPTGLLEPVAGAGCYCPACLDARINAAQPAGSAAAT